MSKNHNWSLEDCLLVITVGKKMYTEDYTYIEKTPKKIGTSQVQLI